uniref:Uncharacterized protein n=1 Tax=Haemonchus contortus TaxID=6289 RepID=A0A7I4YNN7_HAECO|nr:gag-pol polyprotein [Haemonchus contortus]
MLDAITYARLTSRILPKRACKLPLSDTVATLKELFGHNTMVFSRRYVCLKTQRNGENLRAYTGLVNQRHAMAEFNDVNPEQMKCLVWKCGLAPPEDADIQARALRKMEDNPQATLKELAAEIQQFLNIRQDATLSELSASSHINAVDSQPENTTHRHHASAVEQIIGQGSVLFVKDLPRVRKFRIQARIPQELYDQEEAET